VLSLIAAICITTGAWCNLLEEPAQWSGHIGIPDGPDQISVGARDEGGLAVHVVSDGQAENHPIIGRRFNEPQDWSRFDRIHLKVRLTCKEPSISSRHFALVLYDEGARTGDSQTSPMRQQVIRHNDIPEGRWVQFDDWLTGVERAAVRQVEVYLYEFCGPQAPPWPPDEYDWELAALELQAIDDHCILWDGEEYPADAFRAQRGAPAAAVASEGGLRLTLGGDAHASTISDHGQVIGSAGKWPTGLMVRDAALPGPPRTVGGALRQVGRGEDPRRQIRQQAHLRDLGLEVRATYRGRQDCIEVAGYVADTTGADRAVTVYLALPLLDAPWLWWDSVVTARTEPDESRELACLEGEQAFGLKGRHSKYPLGAVSLPGHGGLTMAVSIGEPVVHRIAYNPSLGMLYVAVDLGLVPGRSAKGRPMSQAPFRFIIYPHDPAWGFRSALQGYYELFPEAFTKRVRREGAWWCWGQAKDDPEAVRAGATIDWGPYWIDQGKYSNEHDMLTLFYLCPEYYEQSMGDYDRPPTPREAWDRVRALAQGNAAQMDIAQKLYHARIGGGHLLMEGMKVWQTQHTVADYLRLITTATLASVIHDVDGRPVGTIERVPWMGDSWRACSYTCNLDPDIPGGKGWFNDTVALDWGFRTWEGQGVRLDGVGLDVIGGHAGVAGINRRREHFRYADVPLTFCAANHEPVQVTVFGTLEWLERLAFNMHERGRAVMTNSGSRGWLTFGAPHIDVFGAERPMFRDPAFMRAIARHKTLADLPYKPQPEWQVASHLLWCVFPGQGSDMQLLAKYTPLLRELSNAGWEPVTAARATPATVRVERYGTGAPVYLVIHNTTDARVESRLVLDGALLARNLGGAEVRRPMAPDPAAQPLDCAGGALDLALEPRETAVLALNQ